MIGENQIKSWKCYIICLVNTLLLIALYFSIHSSAKIEATTLYVAIFEFFKSKSLFPYVIMLSYVY